MAIVTVGMVEGGDNSSASSSPEVQEDASLQAMQNLKFDPTSYDFGPSGYSTHYFTFYLKNYSTQPASGSVAIYGDDPFSCYSGCTYNLGHNESQAVMITFTPTANQSYNATLYAGNASASVSGSGGY
jgi:hypothetical protein